MQALLVRRVEDVLVGTVTATAACRSGGLTAFAPGHARRREVVAQVRAEMHRAGRYDLIRARPVVTPRQPAWLGDVRGSPRVVLVRWAYGGRGA
ncbi:hypothetical protein [Streptomyces sp. NPDC102476]|uniref:hypothetical protein n=1 Tax=Streptomyces sp. NPDC102476 TaxID=3366181 RepID=UPI003823525D